MDNIDKGRSQMANQLVELKIPQMGEGLREIRIVRLLKELDDLIKEDEIIYEMETDKSLVEVESPYNGYIKKWLAQKNDILEVGSVLAIVELLERQNCSQPEPISSTQQCLALNSTTTSEISLVSHDGKLKPDLRNIPPRIRAYCKQYNLSDEVILTIPYTGKALTIGEVEKFLAIKVD